jgi:2-polyprenyl-6-methoxyphenol hydroxylase-like FAD-dependent oxidoreductase
VVSRRTGECAVLKADLVVDATGRAAHTPGWLEGLGYDRPLEDRVVVHLTYASQLLRMTADAPRELGFLVGIVPGRPRGVGLLHCEHDTWMFTVIGIAGQEPGGDLAAMCEFVADCAPAHLLDAVRRAEPIGEPTRHKMPCSQWRRYDKLRRFPEGLLVTGDAVCSFNPVYGQGMTVAALEALALRDCLAAGERDLARRFFTAAAKSVDVPWRLAAGADLRFPHVPGPRPLSLRVVNAYVGRLQRAAAHDTTLGLTFMRVANLIASPATLFRPDIVIRVLLGNLRHGGAAVPVTPATDVVEVPDVA